MISVIMPVFNTKQYLEQAIESVLYQGVASPEASARFYYDQSSIFSIGLWILCMCEGSISIYNGKKLLSGKDTSAVWLAGPAFSVCPPGV